MKQLFACAVLLLFSTEIKAQEVCVGILDKLGRDISYENREDAKAKNIYDQFCEGASEKSGRTTTVGLEAVVKAIPIKLNVGTGSNQEKLRNFCRTYSESSSQSSAEIINTSTVVREAFSAFNGCVALTLNAIAFSPTIGTSLLTVGIRRTDAADVEFLGVTYDSKLLDCKGPAGKDEQTVLLDNKSRKKLSDRTFPVTCERKPVVSAAGGRNYPRAEIVFAMSKGSPLLIPIPAEEVVPTKTASEIQAQLDILKGQIGAIGSRNPQIDCKTEPGPNVSGRNPVSVALVPEQFLKQGYAVVGGGCMQGSNLNMFIKSFPEKNAWSCQVADMPGVETGSSVQAAVTFCKVTQ